MSKPRIATLSIVAITLTAVVAGCGGPKPSASADVAIAVPVSTPTSAPRTSAPATPKPTAAATPAATPTQTPTPIATPEATPAPTATPSLVANPKLTKDIAGATRVKYFPIVGNSPAKLVAQIVAKSAKPCRSRSQDVLACVIFRGGGYRWINTTNPSTGACTVTAVTIVKPTSTVHLPQWVGPAKVEPALLAWWKPVLDHFAWHEEKHIRIQQAFEKKLRPRLMGHRCSAARGIIRRWERNLAAAQHTFDVKDYSWQPETSVPYHGPQS